MWPKVSIIWLNYNSRRILDIVLRSLESIVGLDYPEDRYELIVVDNGSLDGSLGEIASFLERSTIRRKVIKLERNLGFTGGNNIGFMARDRESEYVLLLNNDAVLYSDGLKALIEYAEQYEHIGGLNGVVLKYGGNIIDSAGVFLSEMLNAYVPGEGMRYPWILKRPYYVTYADGCCALYKVDHLLRCCGGRIFVNEGFMYFDDYLLGLMLWNHGFKLACIPKIVAEHASGSTIGEGSPLQHYFGARGRVALSLISNSRFKELILLQSIRGLYKCVSLRSSVCTRTVIDGLKLGKLVMLKYGIFIDLYKAPIIKLNSLWALGHLIFTRSTGRRILRRIYEDWFIKNLKKLTVD